MKTLQLAYLLFLIGGLLLIISLLIPERSLVEAMHSEEDATELQKASAEAHDTLHLLAHGEPTEQDKRIQQQAQDRFEAAKARLDATRGRAKLPGRILFIVGSISSLLAVVCFVLAKLYPE